MMYRGTAKAHDKPGYEDGYRAGRRAAFLGYPCPRDFTNIEFGEGYTDAFARLSSPANPNDA